jgi:hypothetical protein
VLEESQTWEWDCSDETIWRPKFNYLMLTELWNYAMSDDASATVLLESLNVIAEPRLNIIIHLTAGCMELLPRETQPPVVNNHRVSYAVDSDISVSTKIIDSSLHVIANVL